MHNPETAPKTVEAGGGSAVSIQGGTYRILASGAQTNGAFATIEMFVPPGGGPGPHAHADVVETFYVVDGEIEFKSESGTYTATKGAYVVIPKGGIVHGFRNKTDQTALLLCTVVPAGLDDFFLEIGQPVTPGAFLPRNPLDPDMLQTVQAAAKKFGQQLFPPDYLDNVT